jgi:hypothetical protein
MGQYTEQQALSFLKNADRSVGAKLVKQKLQKAMLCQRSS